MAYVFSIYLNSFKILYKTVEVYVPKAVKDFTYIQIYF